MNPLPDPPFLLFDLLVLLIELPDLVRLDLVERPLKVLGDLVRNVVGPLEELGLVQLDLNTLELFNSLVELLHLDKDLGLHNPCLELEPIQALHEVRESVSRLVVQAGVVQPHLDDVDPGHRLVVALLAGLNCLLELTQILLGLADVPEQLRDYR